MGKSDVRTCEIPVMGMEGWALVNLKLIFVKIYAKIYKETKMVLDNLIDVKLSTSNRKHYLSLGYDGKLGEIIQVFSNDLPDGTSIQEERQCDCCGKRYKRRHSQHLKSFKIWGEDLCIECSHDEIHKNKTVAKRENTCIEKYGEKNPSCVKEFQQNRENTMVERYGVVNYFQSKEFQEKVVQTSLEKYGTERPNQSEEIKEKIKKTCLERYGVENPTLNPEIRAKQVEVCIEKYGAVSSLGNAEIREKGKKTMLELYGYEQAGFCPELIQKATETRKKNGKGITTSSQQIKVKDMIEEMYPNYYSELNYVLSSLFLDLCLFINDEIKIDIEYDGNYWHKDFQKDRRRDEFVKSQGFKILRIRSGHLLPSKEQLEEGINKLINGYNFTTITLRDWKNN